MKSTMAVLWRDLASLPRRKRFYLKRAAVIMVGGLALMWGLWMTRGSQDSTIGLVLFSSLTMTSLVALLIISITTACWSVVREREERTLGLLVLSDISTRGFVCGKAGTSLFSTTMTILSILPLFILAISLGGISIMQVLTAFGILLSTIFLGTGIGLLGSCSCTETRQANSLTAFLSVLWFIVAPIAAILLLSVYSNNYRSADFAMSIISPFAAMSQINYGNQLHLAGLNCALSLALGTACIAAANAVLPRTVVSRERPSVAAAVREKMRSSEKTRKWVIPARILGNPVAWKDHHYYHGGTRATWTKFAVASIIVLALTLLIGASINSGRLADTAKAMVVTQFIFSIAVFSLGSISHFGMTFNRERRSRSLEVLLTSGLTDGEIVQGKILAVVRSLLPWFLSVLVCGVIIATWLSSENGFSEVAVAMFFEYAGMWFAYSALALWMSLKFKRAVAFPACILLFLLWNSFGRIITTSIMIAGADFDSVVAMDTVIHIVVGVVFLTMTSGSLRRIVAEDG